MREERGGSEGDDGCGDWEEGEGGGEWEEEE